MTGVLIAADKTDKKMWKTFPAILCKTLDARYWQSGEGAEARPPLTDEQIVVCDIAGHDVIRPDHTIIVWKENVAIPATLTADEKTVAVVNTDGDPQKLGHLSDTTLPVITCGMSARDTLTLSSYGSENTVITLQRSLVCFDGKIAEPQEIPIAVADRVDSFTLMATAAVFLLTGNRKLLHSADFDVDAFK